MAHNPSQQSWPLGDVPSHPAGANDDFPPPPPAHRVPVGMHPDSSFQRHYPDPNNYSDYSTPGQTPGGEDTMGDTAHATRSIDSWGPGRPPSAGPGRPMGVPDRSSQTSPFNDQGSYEQPMIPRAMYSQRSYGSGAPLAAGAAPMYSSNSSLYSMPQSSPHGVPYADTPYNRYSSSAQNLAPQLGQINPYEVDNDDDWGMGPDYASPQNKRRSRSFVPFGGSRDGPRDGPRDGHSSNGSPGSSINSGAAGAGLGAGAGAGAGAAAAKYDPVPTVNASGEFMPEKSNWKVEDDLKKRKKRMWIAIVIIFFILAAAILGGVLGATLGKGGSGPTDAEKAKDAAQEVEKDNKNDLGKDSDEIKALMNNKDLHKVFPGVDYTPLNSQYPDCLHVKPSQNNITRDMAVMSQLTDSVRLYGTDCNQTQMLIHAIDRLELKDSMKIWLGVWLDSNDTTTDRQIRQTWDILDDYGCDYFKGIIIGNEVLYREDLTATELLGHISDFRQNITDHKCKLPVAMADLGDNWTADMATKVDIVMSNIHPFFSGTSVKEAADWTWNFWQNHDIALTAGQNGIHQIIAEVGWPSGGGTNCGGADSCAEGSVAGVDEMNQFMEDWICPSLQNGTEYFWFSMFDEPWKVAYNEKGKEWEDKWGLMDVDRNLKPGLKIPDCGGKSLPSSYEH